MKQKILVAVTALTMASTVFAGANFSSQTENSKRVVIEQKGRNNTAVLNEAESKSQWNGIKQDVTSDRIDVNQTGRNGIVYLNKAKTSGKTLVIQKTETKRLNVKQNGSGNKFVGNHLTVD